MSDHDHSLPLGAYILKEFPVQPSVPGNVVQPGTVVDGAGSSLGFKPMLLTISVTPKGSTADFTAANFGGAAATVAGAFPSPGGQSAGDVDVQVMGQLMTGGFYLRRFTLAPYRQAQFDCSRWRDVRVDVLRSTAVGAAFYAVVANQPAETTIDEQLVYAERYVAAGTYLVPPGATAFWPAVADAGFTWVTGAFSGQVTSADPAAVSTKKDVKGTHFTTTVPTFAAVWEITT